MKFAINQPVWVQGKKANITRFQGDYVFVVFTHDPETGEHPYTIDRVCARTVD